MSTPIPRIAVEPKSGRYEALEAAVRAAGGQVVAPAEAEALVWADGFAIDQFPALLEQAAEARWIALPFAGIEPYLGLLHDQTPGGTPRVWTAAKGVYAKPVAEHALALTLAGMRGLAGYARAEAWSAPVGRNLLGANVVIFGAGGITTELIRLLEPFDAEITVVRRRPEPVRGAHHVVALADRLEVLPHADAVVLALALTPETMGVIGRNELTAMKSTAWLVNVARGGHIDTDALVEALRAGEIGGAGLDVTAPEPLPPGHPLWGEPGVIITPHVGNTPEMGVPLLAAHIGENVARFARGVSLVGQVDVEAGY